MTSVYKHKRGGWYVSVYLPSKRRELIYLGKLTKKQAETINNYMEDLRRAAELNIDPQDKSKLWALGTSSKLQLRLRKIGLLRVPELTVWTLQAWADQFVAKSSFAESTRSKFDSAVKHIVASIGDKPLPEITVGDCKRLKQTLEKNYAETHVSKIVQRARQILQAAVDDRQLTANPCDGIKLHSRVDKTRQAYIEVEAFNAVLEAAPHQEARVLYAFARYGGLRVPTEPLALRWSDIDWDKQRFRVADETKTGQRFAPIFTGVLFDELRRLFESAEPGEYVITKARQSAATTWREWILTSIKTAKQEPWPKLWMNLRASCRTDLEECFPSHVCDAWLGHGYKVARDHYLRVKPSDWAKATRTAQTDAHSVAHSAEKV